MDQTPACYEVRAPERNFQAVKDFQSSTYYKARVLKFDCSDFIFGEHRIYKSSEEYNLDYFKLNGGSVVNKNNIIDFLKNNSFVSSNLNEVVGKIYEYFGNVKLRIELSRFDGETPELFLIVQTEDDPQEAYKKLKDFDNWFVPEIFEKTDSFNVNIEFI